MVYEEFLSTVASSLKSRLGSDYTIDIQKVPKNNGTALDGLCITKTGSRITPTIYLNSFFEHWKSGVSLHGILEEIIHIYTDGITLPQISPELLSDIRFLKDKIVYKLVHTKSNENLLHDIPHIPYLDLSIIFYLYLDETDYGHMTATIHHNHMKSWGMTVDELYQLASRNTPRLLPLDIKSMDKVIEDLVNSQSDSGVAGELLKEHAMSDSMSPMYVMTNSYGINGSCTILYDSVLKNFAELSAQDLIILPSSIHEVLLIPYTKTLCLEDLFHMVKYINLTEVPVEDRLSNEVYRYYRSEDQVSLVPHLSEYQTS